MKYPFMPRRRTASFRLLSLTAPSPGAGGRRGALVFLGVIIAPDWAQPRSRGVSAMAASFALAIRRSAFTSTSRASVGPGN